MPNALRIGLLGPLRLQDEGGCVVPVGGLQLRVLFTLLALNTGVSCRPGRWLSRSGLTARRAGLRALLTHALCAGLPAHSAGEQGQPASRLTAALAHHVLASFPATGVPPANGPNHARAVTDDTHGSLGRPLWPA